MSLNDVIDYNRHNRSVNRFSTELMELGNSATVHLWSQQHNAGRRVLSLIGASKISRIGQASEDSYSEAIRRGRYSAPARDA